MKTTGFNRYIVECKCLLNLKGFKSDCFNRYIVECKCRKGTYGEVQEAVLIDT